MDLENVFWSHMDFQCDTVFSDEEIPVLSGVF